ncbi:hypothetical protein ACHAXN_012747 [Cyclotella atomus]
MQSIDTSSYLQVIEGKKFLIHCHREDKYVQKIMSKHGMTVEVEVAEAWRRDKDGQWAKFNYTEPIANHVTSKHWVDDVNNRRHAPIDLEDGWATKWKKLAKEMMQNKITESGGVRSSPVRAKTHNRESFT